MPRIPTDRVPTHPGELLLKEFLEPMEVTQVGLADAIGVPYQRVNEIVNGRRGVSPSTALRFSRFFATSVEFWMNLQAGWDLYHAAKEEAEILEAIHTHPAVNASKSPA